MTNPESSEIRREAEAYAHRSDERGRLAGHVLSLLAEVERLRKLAEFWNKGHARHCAMDAPCSVDEEAMAR